MRLLRVELTRLRARRAVLLLLAAAVLIPLVVGLASAWNTRPLSDGEQVELDRTIAAESARPWVRKELKRCLAKPRQWGIDADSEDVQAQCEEYVLPQAEWFGSRQPLDLAQEREEGTGLAVVAVLVMTMLVAGTTFAGHDWGSGSMSNQLLFEPRRVRVWLAKALAATGAALAVALAVSSAYWLGLYAVARSRDLGVGDGVLLDGLQQGWRGAGLAAAAALAGYALTMLFRSTVATLGVLFAVAVVGGMLIAAVGVENSGRWQPQNNLAAIVMDGAEVHVQVPEECYGPLPPGGDACDESYVLSARHGTVYTGSFLLVGSALSVLSFRRRDVP